jgi:hypothetical protein
MDVDEVVRAHLLSRSLHGHPARGSLIGRDVEELRLVCEALFDPEWASRMKPAA